MQVGCFPRSLHGLQQLNNKLVIVPLYGYMDEKDKMYRSIRIAVNILIAIAVSVVVLVVVLSALSIYNVHKINQQENSRTYLEYGRPKKAAILLEGV